MVRYQLDALGWLQFEQLCQSLLKKHFSVGVESWGGHSDRGRDAYCSGPISFGDGDVRRGPIAFQVKFVEGANAAGARTKTPLLKAIRAECKEISKRLKKSQWGVLSEYVLITNSPLSTSLRTDVEKALRDILSNVRVTCWGNTDVSDLLDEAPNLRVAFPQLLGIRDFEELLSNVVNKATLERSRSAIEYAREVAPVFVPTDAYFRSLQVLATHSFAVLTGPPEMGKTTIARMIGLTHLSQGWDYYDCFSPKDYFENIDPDKHQVFVADDAFGTTEYHPELALPWGMQLANILRRLGPRRWLIWTTRPAPLQFALRHLELQELAEQFPKPADVEVNAEALSNREKAMILYRHAKAADLEDRHKSFLKAHLDPVISEPTFTPERIRRFVSENLQDLCERLGDEDEGDDSVFDAISSEIAEPTQRMRKSFELIDDDHKHLMIAMLDADTGTARADFVQKSYERLFSDTPDILAERLAESLNGHFIRVELVPVYGRSADRDELARKQYRWIHPSWRDLAIDYLSERRQLRHRFLSRCGIGGIQLALSVGGGAVGLRKFPLLVDDNDWHTLENRLVEIVSTCRDSEIMSAFNVVADVLQSYDEKEKGELSVLRNRIGVQFLDAVRLRWNEGGERIELRALKRYFQLSMAVTPIPPSPNLYPTWTEIRDALMPHLESDDHISWLMTPLSGFVDFAQTLFANAPRFAIQQRLSSGFDSEMSSCLDRIATECDGWQHYVESKDELESELADLEEIGEVVEAIDELYPKLRGQAKQARESVDAECDLVREKIDEHEKKEEETEEKERQEAEEEYRQLEELAATSHLDSPKEPLSADQPTPLDWIIGIVEVSIDEIFEDL